MSYPEEYIEDEVYGQRLLISVNADPRELKSNIRAAKVSIFLLCSKFFAIFFRFMFVFILN